MNLWRYAALILAAIALVMSIDAWFLWRRVLGFFGVNTRKWYVKLLCVVLVLPIILFMRSIRSPGLMIVMHIFGISILLDLAVWILRLVWKRFHLPDVPVFRSLYRSGALLVMLCVAVIGYSYWNMAHVRRTEYSLETQKLSKDYRILLIADTHYGTIQSKDLLKSKIAEMNEQHPDIAVLCGDIVEEGTSAEDMREVFSVLAGIDAPLGIYYVYGNHDRQLYVADRAYTQNELRETIESNGITVLQDAHVVLNDELFLAGREDAFVRASYGRTGADALLADAEPSMYTIVLDHQPEDYDEVGSFGADLQLSGHTHAGQFWPIGLFTVLSGGLNYGLYHEKYCDVIVTSGFTGCGFPMRTQKHCEYVMITIHGTGGGENA